MKRQECLFLILVLLYSLQAGAYALPPVSEEYGTTTRNYNSIYSDIILSSPILNEEGIRLFEAKIENERVSLNWEIEGDFHTSSFILERRTVGTDFTMIGGVKEKGERSTIRNYSFADILETQSAPYRQYRLKQKFTDGSYIYHPTITVLVPTQSELKAYPSPVTDKLSVMLPQTDAANYQVSIYNQAGVQLNQMQITAMGSSMLQSLDMSDYQSGLLILKVEAGSQQWQFKIMKK